MIICPIPVRTWVGSVIHEPPPPPERIVVVVRTTHVCVRRKQHENMCVARVCESSPGPQQSEDDPTQTYIVLVETSTFKKVHF